MTVDVVNAIIESIAIFSAAADIRRLLIDKDAKGFSVWMLIYCWFDGLWETYVAWKVVLPISAIVIGIWTFVYVAKVILPSIIVT